MTEPTLIDFLEARLDERERKALDAAKWYGKDWEDHGNHVVMDDAGANVILDRASEYDEMDAAVAALVVDNDPRFVLADIVAQRQILELHGHEPRCGYEPDDDATPGAYGHVERACETCGAADAAVRWPCKTLRLLALPFASHPDYRPEWAPEVQS